MDVMEFTEAESDLHDLISEYQQYQEVLDDDDDNSYDYNDVEQEEYNYSNEDGYEED